MCVPSTGMGHWDLCTHLGQV
uniref:Uncharacterized protein n=1 Tax=Anguilla anguilla TaxID=7936 RepID=A0A0E9SH80_ANGAN